MQPRVKSGKRKPTSDKSPADGKPSRQTKLSQHFAPRELCPHCPSTFSDVALLIQHVESEHLTAGIKSSDIAKQVHHASPARTAGSLNPSSGPCHSFLESAGMQCAEGPIQQWRRPAASPNKQEQEHLSWWRRPCDDPVVAHIRFKNGSTSSNRLQPVRQSGLQSVAPVELVLNFLPPALANKLLKELLVQSETWVAGKWWFGGQQQTAPRSSATYSLASVGSCGGDGRATASHRHGSGNPSTSDDSVTAAQAAHELPPPQHQATDHWQLDDVGSKVHLSGTQERICSDPPHSAQLDMHGNTLHGGSSQARSQPNHLTDLANIPQLPPPIALQQAACLASQAVNSRMVSLQHAHWQHHRQQLLAQLAAARIPAARIPASTVHGSHARVQECLVHDPKQPQLMQQQLLLQRHMEGRQLQEQRQQQQSAEGQQQQQQQQPWKHNIPGHHHRQQQKADRQQQQQPVQPEHPWCPSYALANMYHNGQQSVGTHADRLNSLGPLPTVASVSLGATRVFRLHPADQQTSLATTAAGTAGRGSTSSTSGRLVSSIDIPLPHNSLLIMWPPTQELWKHEVPKTKKVSAHPLSGEARINLTFRQLQPSWATAVPDCRCGRPAIMRSTVQDNTIVYYYACDNMQGPGCGLHQQAVALQHHADEKQPGGTTGGG